MKFEYKNYHAECEYDETADVYFGEVMLIQDVVTFEGKTAAEAEKEFRESVDIYIEWCEQEGSLPNKSVPQAIQNARAAY